MLFGNGRRAFNIDDIQQRVGWRFYPDQLRIFIHILFNVRNIGHGNKVKLNAVILEDLGKNAVAAAVQIVGGNYFVAGHQHFYNRIDGCHTRSKAKAVLAVFQGCQGIL